MNNEKAFYFIWLSVEIRCAHLQIHQLIDSFMLPIIGKFTLVRELQLS